MTSRDQGSVYNFSRCCLPFPFLFFSFRSLFIDNPIVQAAYVLLAVLMPRLTESAIPDIEDSVELSRTFHTKSPTYPVQFFYSSFFPVQPPVPDLPDPDPSLAPYCHPDHDQVELYSLTPDPVASTVLLPQTQSPAPYWHRTSLASYCYRTPCRWHHTATARLSR